MYGRRALLWLGLMLMSGVAVTQQQTKAVPRTIRLFVVVSTRSGHPVTDLNERDFSLWDNNLPTKILSFRVGRFASNVPPQTFPTSAGGQRDGKVGIYELTFNAATAKQPNEHHVLGVKVDRPNLNVVAQQGYYAQP